MQFSSKNKAIRRPNISFKQRCSKNFVYMIMLFRMLLSYIALWQSMCSKKRWKLSFYRWGRCHKNVLYCRPFLRWWFCRHHIACMKNGFNWKTCVLKKTPRSLNCSQCNFFLRIKQSDAWIFHSNNIVPKICLQDYAFWKRCFPTLLFDSLCAAKKR